MTSGRIVKSQLYQQFARIGKALDSPQRLELLDLLCQAERSVEDLAREAHMTVANTSRHLQALRSARLVDMRKAGVKVFYRLSDGSVCEFFHTMRRFAEERLLEVDAIVKDFFDDPSLLQPIDRTNLMRKAQAGEVIILDVRPTEEFRQGHLPAAQSVPLGELESRLADIPFGSPIVAYCRGPYCVLAQEAVNQLRARGYSAIRIPDGVHEWMEAGLPIESIPITTQESA